MREKKEQLIIYDVTLALCNKSFKTKCKDLNPKVSCYFFFLSLTISALVMCLEKH